MVISMIIDIRENYEYKMGHIDNSINVPMDLILLVPEKNLKKNKVEDTNESLFVTLVLIIIGFIYTYIKKRFTKYLKKCKIKLD